MTSDNVRFSVETQETIFSEIALDAQTAIKAQENLGYGLATNQDMWTRAALPMEILTQQLDSWNDAQIYPLVIEMAATCLLWAMLIRQRNAPNMPAPVITG
jgi:hypothetical protein